MRARIAKANRDEGFTLIELLVAIAVPVFLNQRQKAQDSATKADVTSIGKEIAAYFVDNSTAPTVTVVSGSYTVNAVTVARQSQSTMGTPAAYFNATNPSQSWCVQLTNTAGSSTGKTWKYSASGGLQNGTTTGCTSGTDY